MKFTDYKLGDFILQASLITFLILFFIYKVLVSNQFPIDKRYDASGFALGHIAEIFSPWYNYDYYPVTSKVADKIAEELNNNESQFDEQKKLINLNIKSHIGASILQGDFLRASYATPSYIILNKISPKLSNQIISITSIFIFLLAGIIKKKFIFHYVICILIISTDYYIYENFFNENIFGLPISLFLFIISLLILNDFKKNNFTTYIVLVLIGIFISLMVNVRTELSLLIFSVIIYLFFYNSVKKFLILITVMLLSYFFTDYLINKSYLEKIERTNSIIHDVGGVVYTGPIQGKHSFIHPFWLGLGDNEFGRKLGHKWDDHTARLRVAELRPDIYELSDICGSRICKYYDEFMIYPSYAEYMPDYQKTLMIDIKNKFVEDPILFIKIYKEKFKNQFLKLSSIHINPNYLKTNSESMFLLKLIKPLFKNLPPNKYEYLNNYFMLPGFLIFLYCVIFYILIFIYIIIKKINIKKVIIDNSYYIVMTFASLPLAIPAIIISDLGATYNSIFHFIILSHIICFIGYLRNNIK
jgi:hypothetical protein